MKWSRFCRWLGVLGLGFWAWAWAFGFGFWVFGLLGFAASTEKAEGLGGGAGGWGGWMRGDDVREIAMAYM